MGSWGRGWSLRGWVVELMGTWKMEEAGGQIGRPGGQGPGKGCRSRLHYPFSKKFLWEELELVREEVTFIYQKLRECLQPTAGGGGWGMSFCYLAPLSPLPSQRHRRRRSLRTW